VLPQKNFNNGNKKMKRSYNSAEEALNDLKERGYDADFTTETTCLYCGDLDVRLNPDEFKVDEEYRFAGDPNHDEDAIVVAITSISGIRGTIVDGYGSYAGSFNPESATRSLDISKESVKN
jgi:hypothetical protein